MPSTLSDRIDAAVDNASIEYAEYTHWTDQCNSAVSTIHQIVRGDQ
jgi:hypothetical protein